jgi:putative aldouronate transport system permease protein
MLGIRFAFTKYTPFADPQYVGLKNFKDLFSDYMFVDAFRNTVFLSLSNLLLAMIFTVGFALLLNEIGHLFFKSAIQTVLYLPHFISWVVVASVFTIILSPSNGLVNQILGLFGFKATYFLASEKWWTPIYLFVSRWKETGYGTIIYLAALSGVNPELYEAAAIDGAGRFKQAIHVTLPAIRTTILIVFILELAKVMNIFQSVFVMMNPTVYHVADVIQTYTYRVGLQQTDYGYSTAIGLFKSVISLVLVIIANKMSKKISGEGILE